ncbi:hypothetical protein [Brevundimonas sp. GCM10030266]|uniref:hypothetical protein n=1 Tax=Brevundimonas sp. GCM10030266 TaxID=3273386 RepID=UPI003605B424
MFASLAAVLLLSAAPVAQDGPVATAPRADQDEGPIATANVAETGESLRLREAVAYANPMPRGAPEADYPLVAWCEALVNGHVALGETLENRDDLDNDIIRLGRLEASDFRAALAGARGRQNAATLSAATAAAAEATAKWTPLQGQDQATRSQAFGLFFGLPGRCEHAARRIRENITTPPATPQQVGLE